MPRSLLKNEKLYNLTHQIITWGLAVLTFLLPLYFLPITVEFYEFNKQILLVAFTIVLAITCALKMVAGGRVQIAKTPLNLPLGLFLLIAALSTIFSANKFLSLMGSYGYFHNNILEVASLMILFFIAATNLGPSREGEIKKIKYAFIASGAAVSILWLLFGFRAIPYLPTGSSTTSVVLAALAFTFSLYHLVTEERWFLKLLFFFGAIPCLLAIISASSFPGWLVFGAGLAGLFITTDQQTLKRNAKTLIFLGMLGVFSAAVYFTPSLREDFGINFQAPREIQLDYSTSWAVAAGSFRDYPLIGSGPGTFILDFTRYKPLSFNATPLWTFNFDRARSEYLQIMAEVGIVGLLVYFFLIWTYLKLAAKSEKRTPWLLLPGLLFLVQFFTSTPASLNFLLFLGLGLMAAESKGAKETEMATLSLGDLSDFQARQSRKDALPTVLFTLSLALLPILYFAGRALAADAYERKGIIASQNGEGVPAYNHLLEAVRLNPWQDIYHNNYAIINLQLAQTLSQREDLNDEDRAQITRLLQQAIREVKISATRLNPLSAQNWQAQALIYRNLSGVSGTEQWALDAYNRAIALDPLNPLLRFGLGEVYYATEDWGRAINAFAAAAQLRGDYANAHYNLAYALKEAERLAEAKTELEITLRLTAPDSADYRKVKGELDELTAQIGEKEEELNISALEASPSTELEEEEEEEETIEQLPLTEPDSIPEASPSAVTRPYLP